MRLASVPVAIALVACGARSDLSGLPNDVVVDAGVDIDVSSDVVVTTGDFAISIQPAQATVVQGGAATPIAIHVVRFGSFTGEVDVGVTGLPTGVVAATATLPSGVADGTLQLVASLQATQGKAPTATVHGSSIVGEHDVPLDVFVRGCPGCIDTTFGTKGFAATSAWPVALAIDSLDRIVVATQDNDAHVMRFSADGVLDATFGDAVPQFGQTSRTLTLTAAGAVILDGADAYGPALARVAPNGKLDTTFGTGGVLRHSTVDPCTFPGVALAPNGDYIALLYCSTGAGGYDAYSKLIAIAPDATIDASFASAGIADFPWTAVDAAGEVIHRMQNGRYVVVGEQHYPNLTPFMDLAAFDGSGAVDKSFGTQGAVTTKDVLGPTSFVEAPSGSIVVGGQGISTNLNSMIVKLASDGAPDTSFGTNGIVALDPIPPTQVNAKVPNSFIQGVAAQSDAKILALGLAATGIPQDISFLLRLNADGTYDTGFAQQGVAAMSFGTHYNQVLVGPALQSDGRIVVAGGYGDFNSNPVTFVARYWP
jgi:uncharacterized delta-60 repeat protein